MAEPSSARLELLYRISQSINSSLDLDVVMESLMDEVIFATRAERGFLMLYDENKQLLFQTACSLLLKNCADSRQQRGNQQ